MKRFNNNTLWMLFEQGIRILTGFFVGLYLARDLGPELFGKINYALAIMAVAMAVGRYGMETILPSRFVQPEGSDRTRVVAFRLLALISVIVFSVTVVIVWLSEADYEQRLTILVVIGSVLFQPALVLEYQLQAQRNARLSSSAKTAALLFSSLIRVAMVYTGLELWIIAVSYLIESILIAIFLILVRSKKEVGCFSGKLNWMDYKSLLIQATPVAASSLVILLYMKIDLLIIKHFLGSAEVGIYTAATKLYEIWIILPLTYSLSIVPKLTQLAASSKIEYEAYITKSLSGLIWLGLLLSIFCLFFYEWIILLLYGSQYESAGPVLSIIMLGAVFNSIGSIGTRHLVINGHQHLLFIRSMLGLAVNVGLNWYLVPMYGIAGSAVAMVLSVFVVYFAANLFNRKTIPICVYATKALLYPFALIKLK